LAVAGKAIKTSAASPIDEILKPIVIFEYLLNSSNSPLDNGMNIPVQDIQVADHLTASDNSALADNHLTPKTETECQSTVA